MLGYWRTNDRYQAFVFKTLKEIALSDPESLFEYKDAISKMLIFNTDPLKGVIAPLYSTIGRCAEVQPEIFRSLLLMNHLQIPLDKWTEKLTNNKVLRAIAGFTPFNLPKTSSYYDFINRIIDLDERPVVKGKKPKPRKKLKKGEKLPEPERNRRLEEPFSQSEKPEPKNSGVVAKIVGKIISDEPKFIKRINRRKERFLQRIFAEVSVARSHELGIIPDSLDVSGDGTCIETGASHYGAKTCKCSEQGIYKCDCPRKFSDPNATWGWDSHNERYFYGYTGYFISTYNKDLKVDLPLYLRLVEASRHDSVSAVFALAEFRDLCPNLHINTFISDSASDNYATYELLDHWDINAVIALNPKNKGNFKYPPALRIDENGVPICPGGHNMVHFGFCGKDRCRIKWRCPRVLGKADPCVASPDCSPSAYGRVIYTKPDWDLRLFTRIPRGSAAWKTMMKQRTAAERVNNRILHHYDVEDSHTRSKKRISFFVTLAAMNVHLDAQLKYLTSKNLFDFEDLFGLPKI
jgi:hypothetical protein